MPRPADRSRPWPRPPAGARPRCPGCGRAVHRLPSGRLLTLQATVGGWTLAPHECLHPAARYPPPEIAERRWTACDVLRMFFEGA